MSVTSAHDVAACEECCRVRTTLSDTENALGRRNEEALVLRGNLEKTADRLQQSQSSLRSLEESSRRQIAQLETERDSTRSRLHTSLADIEALHLSGVSHSEGVQSLRNDLETATTKLEESRSQEKQYTKQIDELKGGIRSGEERLREVEQHQNQLAARAQLAAQAQLERYTNQITELEGKLHSSEEQLHRAEQQLHTCTEQSQLESQARSKLIHELESNVRSKDEQLRKLENELRACNEQNRLQSETIGTRDARIEHLEFALRQQSDELQEKLDAVQNLHYDESVARTNDRSEHHEKEVQLIAEATASMQAQQDSFTRTFEQMMTEQQQSHHLLITDQVEEEFVLRLVVWLKTSG